MFKNAGSFLSLAIEKAATENVNSIDSFTDKLNDTTVHGRKNLPDRLTGAPEKEKHFKEPG